MGNSNEYMRRYFKKRYYQRINKALKKLRNKCVKCLKTTDLQFDHIDRSTKLFAISDHGAHSEEKFWLEVAKCQLLCEKCHQTKTLIDFNRLSAKETHGTLSSYRYCKCELCKKAKSTYMKEYFKTHKRNRKQLFCPDSSTDRASDF